MTASEQSRDVSRLGLIDDLPPSARPAQQNQAALRVRTRRARRLDPNLHVLKSQARSDHGRSTRATMMRSRYRPYIWSGPRHTSDSATGRTRASSIKLAILSSTCRSHMGAMPYR